MQDLPHIRRTSFHIHLAVQLQGINGSGPCRDQLKKRQYGCHCDKRIKPGWCETGQQPVIKDPGHDRIDNTEQIRNDRSDSNKSHGGPCADQAFSGK